MRVGMADVSVLCCVALVGGCASAPRAEPGIAVTVMSAPERATVSLHGRALGVTPVEVTLPSLADVLAIDATLTGSDVIETRVHVVGPTRATVLFRFGVEVGALARRLGLARVLVFDYAANATFDIDRDNLKEEFLPLLREQAAMLNRYFPGVEVYVCGHTDDTGTRQHNLELSLRRAQSVSAFLASCGVEPKRLVAQGFGEDYPVETNATPEGRAFNRRTEIMLPR